MGNGVLCVIPLSQQKGTPVIQSPGVLSEVLQQPTTKRPNIFPDDPPALDARAWNFSPITHEEIASALAGILNKSAPGPLGPGYLAC